MNERRPLPDRILDALAEQEPLSGPMLLRMTQQSVDLTLSQMVRNGQVVWRWDERFRLKWYARSDAAFRLWPPPVPPEGRLQRRVRWAHEQQVVLIQNELRRMRGSLR